MKQPYFIMSLLIPSAYNPGMGVDVFFELLIKELCELWEDGVQTFDAYIKQNFTMHVTVLWLINDFPSYRELFGWSIKRYLAYPSYHKDMSSHRLDGL